MEEFQKFLDQFRSKHFEKGDMVLYQGEVPRGAMIIKNGILKTYNISAEGDEKPLAFDIAYDMLPITWIFNKTPSALYFYEAFSACDIYIVPRDDLLKYLQTNPVLLFKVMNRFVAAYAGQTMRLNALEYSRAIDKIVHTLHFLCLRFGEEKTPGIIEIQIPFSQQDLANLMGLTRETTGIELKKLQKRNVLTYHLQRYRVRLPELLKLLGEEELLVLQLKSE